LAMRWRIRPPPPPPPHKGGEKSGRGAAFAGTGALHSMPEMAHAGEHHRDVLLFTLPLVGRVARGTRAGWG